MQMIIALLVPSLIVGAAVVFFLPLAQNVLGQIQQPTVRSIISNRFVQVILVGLIVSLGIGLFTSLAKSLKISR